MPIWYPLAHSYVKDVTGSTDFFVGVKHAARTLPQLTGFDKGEKWGAKLMEYAWEHPLKQSRKRQIIEVLDLVLYWETTVNMERYEDATKSNMVDPQTGELIARPSPVAP